MAERREGPFPVEGELVTADNGRVAVFMDGRWEVLDSALALSLAESRAADAREREVRARLKLALSIWEHAAAACPLVRVRGADIRRSDPLPTFVELLARAALTDCIAETCDGHPLGLFEHTLSQVRGLLSPSSEMRLRSMLQRLTITARTRPLLALIDGGSGTPGG